MGQTCSLQDSITFDKIKKNKGDIIYIRKIAEGETNFRRETVEYIKEYRGKKADMNKIKMITLKYGDALDENIEEIEKIYSQENQSEEPVDPMCYDSNILELLFQYYLAEYIFEQSKVFNTVEELFIFLQANLVEHYQILKQKTIENIGFPIMKGLVSVWLRDAQY